MDARVTLAHYPAFQQLNATTGPVIVKCTHWRTNVSPTTWRSLAQCLAGCVMAHLQNAHLWSPKLPPQNMYPQKLLSLVHVRTGFHDAICYSKIANYLSSESAWNTSAKRPVIFVTRQEHALINLQAVRRRKMHVVSMSSNIVKKHVKFAQCSHWYHKR